MRIFYCLRIRAVLHFPHMIQKDYQLKLEELNDRLRQLGGWL
jgi:hypothetical protein